MARASDRAWLAIDRFGFIRAARIGAVFALLLSLPLVTAAAQQSDNAKPATASAKPPKKPAAQLSSAGKTAPAKTAASQPAQTVSVPPPEVLLMLVRTTLVALNQANFTGNYTVLHGLGSPQLQAKNTGADLGNAFAGLRAQAIDLSPVLVLTPQLSEKAGFTGEGALRLVGFFPSKPLQIQFVMNFLPVNNHWRIDGLSVSAVPAPQAAAPAPAPVSPPQ